jgi:16S rRNA (uracil1498-N3)-methyltransferase
LIRAPIQGLAPGERTLEGALAHYLVRVIRLRAGDTFVAFDPAGGVEADALVIHEDGEAITVRFEALRPGAATAAAAVTWIQGFAKGDKCDAIVRDATELGASQIVVATTMRSVVKLDGGRAEARATRWARIAEEAARQCGRSAAPKVGKPVPWPEALASAGQTGARFCLWERATQPLAPALQEAMTSGQPLAFACGPEGGLDSTEVDQATAQGWLPVSLGPLVLRTETVAAAVLGAVTILSKAR